MDNLREDIDDVDLKEELNSCNHFLVDSEVEKGRHCVFNFAMSTFNNSFLIEKLDHMFNQLKYAAKVNLVFGFVLKNFEDGKRRYFNAHDYNTVTDRYKLVCNQDDMVNLIQKVQKSDNVDCSTRERANTKWIFYKLTSFTVFAQSIKDIPMVPEDTVLTEPLSKNHNVNSVTLERNTTQPYFEHLCLFRALALHLQCNDKLKQETSRHFTRFLTARKKIPQNFKMFT